MTLYSLYYLDAFSGHIDSHEFFEAEDDVRAVHACRGKSSRQAVELWRGHTKVHRFEATDGPESRISLVPLAGQQLPGN